MSNIIGLLYKVSTFGESHGNSIGCIIDGCPPGILITNNDIQYQLNRRRPGFSDFVTPRKEFDQVIILSGIYNNRTTGTPIALIVKNYNIISSDYSNLISVFRPGHSDISYYFKYGIVDYRGGGRASARTTIAIVLSGAIAKKILYNYFNIKIYAYINTIGKINFNLFNKSFNDYNLITYSNQNIFMYLNHYLNNIRLNGNSIGSILSLNIYNLFFGIGQPLFNKLHSSLAYYIFSLNAVKAIEFGNGFTTPFIKGSINNDSIFNKGFNSNLSGGILGGISTSQDININIYIKPTSSISSFQNTINTNYNNTSIYIKGRHDPCVGIRAISILESIASISLIDLILIYKSYIFF